MRRRIRRPSPALVISLIALFVALGGTTYAGVTLSNGSVTTNAIATGAVTQPKIAPRAVTTSRIGLQAIYNSRLQPQAVSPSKIQNNAVLNNKIAPGAVNSNSIATSGVANQDLGPATVTASKLGALTIRTQSVTLPANNNAGFITRAVQSNCNTGEVAVSGGAAWDVDVDNQPLRQVYGQLVAGTVGGPPTGYRARGASDMNQQRTFTAQVLCLAGP
jgi:hypothetical protein